MKAYSELAPWERYVLLSQLTCRPDGAEDFDGIGLLYPSN